METTAQLKPNFADPRSRSVNSWRSSLGVMASRGETTGPRVEEAQHALGFYRLQRGLDSEVERGNIDAATASEMLDILTRQR